MYMGVYVSGWIEVEAPSIKMNWYLPPRFSVSLLRFYCQVYLYKIWKFFLFVLMRMNLQQKCLTCSEHLEKWAKNHKLPKCYMYDFLQCKK